MAYRVFAIPLGGGSVCIITTAIIDNALNICIILLRSGLGVSECDIKVNNYIYARVSISIQDSYI